MTQLNKALRRTQCHIILDARDKWIPGLIPKGTFVLSNGASPIIERSEGGRKDPLIPAHGV